MRCEEFVREYLPSVKAELGRILCEECDFTQTEVSEMLDITQPAVSQYLQEKRGKNKRFSEPIKEEIKEVAKEVCELNRSGEIDTEKVDELMCRICKKI